MGKRITVTAAEENQRRGALRYFILGRKKMVVCEPAPKGGLGEQNGHLASAAICFRREWPVSYRAKSWP
jgi:hypothetical protein